MAELTNIDGLRLRFDAKSVTAVADHDDAGNPGTYVYGVMKTAQHVMQAADDFLTGLAIRQSFVPLNRPSGTRIWINAGAVDYVRERLPTDIPTVGSVVSFGGTPQALAQNYATAAAALHAVNNKL